MNTQIRGLHETAYLLAIFTFLSQILALVRDRTFAHFFGADAVLDAYFAAFRIPDVVFAFLTLFVSSFALIPLFARRGGSYSESSRRLTGAVLTVFAGISIVVSVLLFIAAPYIVPILFPGFDASLTEVVIQLTRIMLLQPILLGFSSVAASVMQSARKFFLYALAPIFYNVGIIFGAMFLYPALGITGLAWGVVFGAVLHLLVQAMPVLMYDKALTPRFPHTLWRDVSQVVLLSLPRALALSSQQALLLVFTGIASIAAVGSVSTLSFGFNLQSVPLAVIGVSYAAALFPSLSTLFTNKDYQTFTKEVWAAVRHTIFWITPAVLLMVVLRAQIVRVVLGSGEFTWADTRLTAAILAGFVISLIAQSSILIFSRAYYAAGRSLEPIVINVSAALAASVAAWYGVIWFQNATVWRYFLEDLFRITDTPGSEVLMIALAYSGVMFIAALLFAIIFARRFGFENRTAGSLLFSFAASVIGASAAYIILQVLGPLLPTDTFLGIFTQGAVAGVVGLGVWVGTLIFLGSRDFLEVSTVFYRLIRQRIHQDSSNKS
ncbi:MAG: murein biosynthesis integral membrane protein MurJ [Patescibacteria group bacterium UBA2163]